MKMILSIIAIALVLFIAFGLFKAQSLKEIHIQKEVVIQADHSEVFGLVKYLENFPKWSPFLAQDPKQIYEVKGNDGTVGAQYHWNGNGGKDLGFQEIAEIRDSSYIKMTCDIQKPFVAHPTFEYSFAETKEGIKVTQDFHLESGLIDAFFMYLFGARKDMEATNQQGLQLLKKAAEA